MQVEDSAQSRQVTAHTADATLDRNDCPQTVTNDGATGTVTLTLPQDAKGGEIVEAVVLAAQNFRLDPGAAGAIYASNGTSYSKQTDGKYLQGSALGEQIKLVADGNGDWIATVQNDGKGAAGFDTIEA